MKAKAIKLELSFSNFLYLHHIFGCKTCNLVKKFGFLYVKPEVFRMTHTSGTDYSLIKLLSYLFKI